MATDLLDVALKAGAGAVVATLAAWSIGRFNNAMAVKLSAERRADGEETDVIALKLGLEKKPPTRVRLTGVQLVVELDGKVEPKLGRTAAKKLRDDFSVEGDRGVILVAGDAVTYEVPLRVPATATVHVKVVVESEQLLFDSLALPRPFWSASLVVLRRTPPDRRA